MHHPRTPKSVSYESNVLGRWRRICVARAGVETRIQGHVIVRGIKARVVEQVEHIKLVFQPETLVDLEHFLQRKIPPTLEGRAEDISPCRTKPRLKVVAGLGSNCSRAARRYTALSRIQQWNAEYVRIEVRFPRVYTCCALRLRLTRGDARVQWQNRVGNEVIRAVIDPRHGS